MKKGTIFTMFVSLLFVLASCGNTDAGTNDNENNDHTHEYGKYWHYVEGVVTIWE